MVEVETTSVQGTRVGSPDFLKRIQSIKKLKGGTLDVLGTLTTSKRTNIFGIDAGGTVHQIITDATGNIKSNIRFLTPNDNLGTVSQIDAIQTLNDIKSGTLDVLKSIQSIDELKSGTLDVLSRVDSIDDLKSGTLDVIQSLQELKSGTLNSVEKVRRPLQKGTIVSAAVPAGGTIGPQAFTENELDKVTFGFNTNVGIAVNHELKIGDQWVTDGSDTISTEGLVTTISHVFSDYRAVRKDPAGKATIATTFSGRN